MSGVLGIGAEALQATMANDGRAGSTPETAILWLRKHAGDRAEEILSLATSYYRKDRFHPTG